MDRNRGPTLAIIGAIVLVIGLLAQSGALSWFGPLPGDLRFGVRVYVPVTSMVMVSVVMTLPLSLFWRRPAVTA